MSEHARPRPSITTPLKTVFSCLTGTACASWDPVEDEFLVGWTAMEVEPAPTKRPYHAFARNLRSALSDVLPELTRAEQAQALGVSKRTLEEWLTGVTMPGEKGRDKIVSRLRVPRGWLFDLETVKEKATGGDARNDRLLALGFEELSEEQRREQLARNIAMRDWPRER